ncbi:MAG: cation:proton antiporter [Thermoanaerobaculia bacterium]|nr:cation:proton antiporter [Thermoanaerobaculia bacterium]
MTQRKHTRPLPPATTLLLGVALGLLPALPAFAAGGGAVLPVLAGLVIVIIGAKLGGELFERLKQPAVLGELVVGVLIGNLGLVGLHALEFLKTDPGLAILGEIGVILLLFQVGLETDLDEMLAVGWSSLLVAVLGVVAPFVLGWGVAIWFVPEESTLAHAFLGATLCATSVGITARVLQDLGKSQTREARIVLGGAVIDDVLGLLVLAVISGLIVAADTGEKLSSGAILLIIAKAAAFLIGAVLVGRWLSPLLFRWAGRLRGHGVLFATALVFCFGLAYLSGVLGLAPIIGAFAAGILLDPLHYRHFLDRGDHELDELVKPLSWLLVPVFFVLMGIRVDLATFRDPAVLGFAAVLTIAAVVGKMLCALGVVERGVDRLSVAVGMVPRGEVGLIFAAIGSTLKVGGVPVISPKIFSAIVIMVIITTLLTPPVLKYTLARADRRAKGRS